MRSFFNPLNGIQSLSHLADACDELAAGIKGFMDREEGRRLFEIAVEASAVAPCLEIGSYCGKSSIYLGIACRETGSVLYSVDHHQGSEEQQPGEEYFDPELFNPLFFGVDTLTAFRSTLKTAGLEETVIPIVCRSEVAARLWRTPLGLVFIDGGHSYEAAAADYRNWAKHIVENGYLMIHDIYKDPAKGGQAPYRVYQEALASGLFKEISMTGSLGVLRRCAG